MGITDLFETSASLPGIAQGAGLENKLSVNNILQKAGIEVNEQGTTAYAATGEYDGEYNTVVIFRSFVPRYVINFTNILA